MRSESLKSIIFIDPSLNDAKTLQEMAQSAGCVHTLTHTKGVLEQIADVVSATENIKSLHIITHGRPGELLLDKHGVSLETLALYGEELTAISQAMGAEGEIYLYGCKVAAGERGAEFVKMIGDITGLKVAAATHKVGHTELGGSWELDFAPTVMSGALEAREWRGVLVDTSFELNLSSAQQWYRPTPGAAIAGDATYGVFDQIDAQSSDLFNYAFSKFSPTVTGAYDFKLTGTALEDSMIFVYGGDFAVVAGVPSGTFIVGDDDSGDDFSFNDSSTSLWSGLDDITLTAGQTYYFIMSSFSTGDSGAVNFTVSGPGSLDILGGTYTKQLSYSATTLDEAVANDGSITTSVTITLEGDTFAGNNGDALGTVTNAPAGLTASLVRSSATTATLTLTGNATNHANADDVSNLTVTFGNADFTGGNASAIFGSVKNNLAIDFDDPTAVKAITYSAVTFVEAAANDGSITANITLTLSNDTYSGTDGQALAGAVATNVPAGLTAVVTKTSDTVATVTFTGNATVHANADDIANLTITLDDTAFTGGSAAAVTNATKSDLVIDFDDSAAPASTTVQFDFSSIFNADVIVTAAEYAADADNTDGYTGGYDDADGAFDSWAAFIENGVATGNGLPSDGVIAAVAGVHPEVTLGLVGNNTWKVSGEQSAIANVTNGNYRTVHVFASAGDAASGGGTTFNIILNYSDGSSTISPVLYAPDWFDDSSVSGRYKLIDNMDRLNTDGSLHDANDPAIFGFAVEADYSKTLTSIKIDVTDNNAGVFGFFGGVATDEVSSAAIAATPQNAAPSITSDLGGATAAINVAENSTTITTVAATDADADTVTYSITGGADSAKFSINATTGALVFASAPNYESPTDSDTNNTYAVEVTANDGNGGTDMQEITVTVTDVNENPAPTPTPPPVEPTPTTPPVNTTIINDGNLTGVVKTEPVIQTVGNSTVTTQTATATRTFTDASGQTVTQNNVTVEALQIAAPTTGVTATTAVPLYWGENSRTEWATTASLSSGLTLSSEGNRAPSATQTTQSAIDNLIYYIQTTVPSTDSTKTGMLGGGSSFLSALAALDTLVVNKITLTSNTSAGTAPATISIDGTANTITTAAGQNIAPMEALVINASTLPSGTTLQLNNVEFGVITGENLTIRGGAGQNKIFTGAGSQDIMCGADDDELHAGAGDDTVGSAGGDDRIFGEEGNDAVFGGEGNDFLHGGSGIDVAAYSGNRADYVVTRDEGCTYVTLKSNPNEADTLINTESIQFADNIYTIEATTNQKQVATLYTQILGRQAEVDGYQFWAHVGSQGELLGAMAISFVQSEEYRNLSGKAWNSLDTAGKVEVLYEAMLGRASDAEGKAFWMHHIQNGISYEAIAEGFIDSLELSGIFQTQEQWNFIV